MPHGQFHEALPENIALQIEFAHLLALGDKFQCFDYQLITKAQALYVLSKARSSPLKGTQYLEDLLSTLFTTCP